MNYDKPVIVSGSSITNDRAWPTWLTWLKQLYGLTNVIDLSTKGFGNKAIILSALHHAQKCQTEPVIILQLTSVDKWDWFIEDSSLIASLKHEKHPVFFLEPADDSGFWCTGSHFPSYKSYFQQHYFSLHYQMFETLSLLHWFQLFCRSKSWTYRIVFESPILAVTEAQLNIGKLTKRDCQLDQLIQNTLCNIVPVDLDSIYRPGLIGYACLNDLPWFHEKFKAHPGSFVHYQFVKDIIGPQLDTIFDRIIDIESLRPFATKFQNLLQ